MLLIHLSTSQERQHASARTPSKTAGVLDHAGDASSEANFITTELRALNSKAWDSKVTREILQGLEQRKAAKLISFSSWLDPGRRRFSYLWLARQHSSRTCVADAWLPVVPSCLSMPLELHSMQMVWHWNYVFNPLHGLWARSTIIYAHTVSSHWLDLLRFERGYNSFLTVYVLQWSDWRVIFTKASAIFCTRSFRILAALRSCGLVCMGSISHMLTSYVHVVFEVLSTCTLARGTQRMRMLVIAQRSQSLWILGLRF